VVTDPGVEAVVAADPRLGVVLDRHGPPPAMRRPPGLRTLVLQILEQQVSLAAGAAHLAGLEAVLGGPPTPAGLAALDAVEARAAGVSRQKHRSLVSLGRALLAGELDLDLLPSLDDEAATSALTRVTGIGPWTAAVHLLSALGRPDVLPVGDRALQVGAAEVLGLPGAPGPAALAELGERWRPNRSAATRLVWHAYLSARGRTLDGG
jgi:DNA-3-methyladenine glycosylase II